MWREGQAEAVELINEPSYNGRPKWSPAGQSFSFISDRSGSNELYLYGFPNGEITPLTENDLREKYTSWMPDGHGIVYTASDDPEGKSNDIFRINILTKEVTRLTNDTLLYEEICVSPDGEWIAYHGKTGGEDHIFLMDINGANKRQLTSARAYHGEPEWVLLK